MQDKFSKDGGDQANEVEEVEVALPSFDVILKENTVENSVEVAVHVAEETSESDEEVIGFSSARTRMIHEKLGISFSGTRNTDKAFTDFFKNIQMENETSRKESIVPDALSNLKKQVGKRGTYLSRGTVEGRKKATFILWGTIYRFGFSDGRTGVPLFTSGCGRCFEFVAMRSYCYVAVVLMLVVFCFLACASCTSCVCPFFIFA